MSIKQEEERGMLWRLRRLAAGYRLIDVAVNCGISASRYSDIERGSDFATERERKIIDDYLPPLPDVVTRSSASGKTVEEPAKK